MIAYLTAANVTNVAAGKLNGVRCYLPRSAPHTKRENYSKKITTELSCPPMLFACGGAHKKKGKPTHRSPSSREITPLVISSSGGSGPRTPDSRIHRWTLDRKTAYPTAYPIPPTNVPTTTARRRARPPRPGRRWRTRTGRVLIHTLRYLTSTSTILDRTSIRAKNGLGWCTLYPPRGASA